MSNTIRTRVCFFLKIAAVASAFGGVLFSLIFAVRDGYSHWSKRLLYFTAQSNLWIGIVFLVFLFHRKRGRTGYLFKYTFTVSITLTGLVFCCLLAPFSDESYHPWSFPNLLTHVFTPTFAVADFFLDDRYSLRKREIFLAVLPPLVYSVFITALEGIGIDFGRGESYPYFFFHYRSPAGIFGFSSVRPFFIGSFYWLTALLLLTLGVGWLYAHKFRLKHKM